MIYSFLHSKSLSIDEFYDIVIFGYLRAIKKYFMNPEIWKYNFSTIVYREMNCELINYFEQNAKMETNVLDGEVAVRDENFDSNLFAYEIKNMVSDEDFLIVQARLNGMSIKEISEYFGYTYYETNKKLDFIKKMIRRLL